MALIDNLVSYWKLDESSGTRADAHGSNDLTDVNTVAAATGIINDGADFESTNNESLTISDASQVGLDMTDDMSVSLWMKIESFPGSKQLAFWDKYKATANQRSVIFQVIGSSQVLECRVWSSTDGNSNSTTTNTLSAGTWYHIVVTYNASTGAIKIYIDGTEASYSTSTTGASNIAQNTENIRIGARSYDTNINPFDGIMDEYGVWNKVLSSAEVTELYNSGAGLAYPFSAGSSNIKSMAGVAQADIKSVAGVANASIKSINGVTNS